MQFPDVEAATCASIEVLTRGVGIQCVELVDDNFMRATNAFKAHTGHTQHTPKKWPEKDSLFFKFQGPSQAALDDTARIVREIVEKPEYGGSGFTLAASGREAEELWQERKNAHYSGLALVEGARGWATDVWWVFSYFRA